MAHRAQLGTLAVVALGVTALALTISYRGIGTVLEQTVKGGDERRLSA
jgi:hypothetical protein